MTIQRPWTAGLAGAAKALLALGLASAWLSGCRPLPPPTPPDPSPHEPPKEPPHEPPKESACKPSDPREDVLAALALRSIQAFGRIDAGVFECVDKENCKQLRLNPALKGQQPERREAVEALLLIVQEDGELSQALLTGYQKSREGCDEKSCGEVRVDAFLVGRDLCNATFGLRASDDGGTLSPERLERFRQLYGGADKNPRIRAANVAPGSLPTPKAVSPGLGQLGQLEAPRELELKGQASPLTLLMQTGSAAIELPTYWDDSCEGTNGSDGCYVTAYDATAGFCHIMSGFFGDIKRAQECCQIWRPNLYKSGALKSLASGQRSTCF